MKNAKPGEWTKTWVVQVTEWSGGKDCEPEFYGPFDLESAEEFIVQVVEQGQVEAERIELCEADSFEPRR